MFPDGETPWLSGVGVGDAAGLIEGVGVGEGDAAGLGVGVGDASGGVG